MKALLAHGASVDAKDDRRGQTALMWAAAEGHAAVVQALIEAGADFRRTPAVRLHAAAVCRERRSHRRRAGAAEGGRGRQRDDTVAGKRSGYGGTAAAGRGRPAAAGGR